MSEKLNFLHINASDTRWGASLAGYRFHKALSKQGYGSRILCGVKETEDRDVSTIMPGRFGYLPNAIVGKFFNYAGLQSFGYPSSFFLKRSKLINDWADVCILRDIHWWYFSIGILPWLSRRFPLIWRVPDMWSQTGHCVYSYECQKWKTGCGQCPHLKDYPELLFDTTKFLWMRKKRIYASLKDKMVFVSPSKWMGEIIKQSPLTKDFRCEVIPSAVDLSTFKPGLRRQARKRLGIKDNEKVIMFSSVKLNDFRKGAKEMREVIDSLKPSFNDSLTVLFVGSQEKDFKFSPGVKVVQTGLITDNNSLVSCYNGSDVYLSMSKADNLPNTLIEASSCGLPIVTLDSGGCAEIIEDDKSGYAVKNTTQAVSALKDILNNRRKQEDFSINARVFAQKHFSMQSQVDSYLNLAKELVNGTK